MAPPITLHLPNTLSEQFANYEGVAVDLDEELDDWQLPLVFNEKRHKEEIKGAKTVAQTWRMKERMKTVSVALVLCLNVGVDPPDVVKTTPCARLECWIDPQSKGPHKALEAIGANLQHQYERWQPRARYKQSLDPTVEEVKKLCSSLRRNAKEERVLFHYNGHGVPRPTVNGEVWVFNKNYTQYIPLSIYDLQTWMGSPSIYVYDCSNAGVLLDSFHQFCAQREEEMQGQTYPTATPVKNCIQLAACSANELLPMNHELPADLFTACLTTPIKMALKWYVLQDDGQTLPEEIRNTIDKIPGQLNDRRTMLGELNWIFTAITDTIAWNILPRDLFQKLFRQDLLVASLFRNFLLAERIMRSYNCTVVSSPELPPTHQHPMWLAWDYALDLCLFQLPGIVNDKATLKHSPFFADQLTAFQVWLTQGSERINPPQQLPIVLQVLLSQVHRLRALDLLGKFLDLGPWAVSLALSVGIFPYVLKLLQSSARELRPLLVFIWAKILAVDSSCQADLMKDKGHKYFLSVLADSNMTSHHRTMAAFVLAMIVNNYTVGQKAATESNMISTCLIQLTDTHTPLRQWLALCLGKVWSGYEDARWCGVRDSAQEKLYTLLADPVPEVRAAAVYALGTFIECVTERSDQSDSIDHGVAMTLIGSTYDASPLVRQELVVSLGALVSQFENQIVAVASKMTEDFRQPNITYTTVTGWNLVNLVESVTSSGIKRSASSHSLRNAQNYNTLHFGSTENLAPPPDPIQMASSSSMTSLCGMGYNTVYVNVFKSLVQLSVDSSETVSSMADKIVHSIMSKIPNLGGAKQHIMAHQRPSSSSAPNSPSNKPTLNIPPSLAETPPRNSEIEAHHRAQKSATLPRINSTSAIQRYTTPFSGSRRMFDKGPSVPRDLQEEDSPSSVIDSPTTSRCATSTELFGWCCRYFAQPIMKPEEHRDPESNSCQTRHFNYLRVKSIRDDAKSEQQKAGYSRLDEEVFINRTRAPPSVVRFHPYKPHLATGCKQTISIWNTDRGDRLCSFDQRDRHDLTAIEFINSHDTGLLLTGSNDGSVSVWKNYTSHKAKLVTAWHALSDVTSSSRVYGLVLDWHQLTGRLIAAGKSNVMRLWDVQQENKIRDIPTQSDNSKVTSILSVPDEEHLIISGCSTGSVRIYDTRVTTSQCQVQYYHEHPSQVLKVQKPQILGGQLVSCSSSGDIRFWDQRTTDSVKSYSTKQTVRAFEMHNYGDVLACGSLEVLSILNKTCAYLNTVKYHEGFMGQRINAVTCMAFHPYKVRLAVGYQNSLVSIYANKSVKP